MEQFKPHIPRFVVAPNDFGFRFLAAFWMDQAYAAMQGQIGANYGHASRVAHIHRHGVGAPGSGAFLPFNEQFDFGNDAFVAAQLGPTLLQRLGNDVRGGIRSHITSH